MAVKMRTKSSESGSFLRLAYSAPTLDQSIGAEVRRFTLPATKALPFIKLRAKDQPMLRPESYWNIRPTGKTQKDIQIGRQYARAAIAAMKADQNSSLIASIIQDIVKDAVTRTVKKGRPMHSATAKGFLDEISLALATMP